MTPSRLSATLRRGWPTASARASAQGALTAGEPGDVAGGLASLLKELDAQEPLAGAPIRASLASALVHFDVVKGDFADCSERQLRNIATACVAELLGERAEAHELRWELQADERHLLVCAIDRAQVASLTHAASSLGLRVSSVTPAFALAWNAFAERLPRGESVFAVSSDADLTIAAVIDGTIAAISVENAVDRPVADPPAAPRASLAKRQDQLADLVASVPAQGIAARCGFSEDAADRPGSRAVDAVVDRFIARLGRDASAQAGHLMVCEDGTAPSLSSRWKTMESPAGMPTSPDARGAEVVA